MSRVAPATPTDPSAALTWLSRRPSVGAAGLAVMATEPNRTEPDGDKRSHGPDAGPPVVLIHGVGADRRCWAPLLPALARRHHVVVVDLPGHGGSEPLRPGEDARPDALARRVGAALTELGIARAHLVANSLGGWVGLELAADGRAASLTALAPAGLRLVPRRPPPVLTLNRLLARATAPFAERVVDPVLGHPLARRLLMASGSERPSAIAPDLARAMAASLRECTGYEHVLAALSYTRFERAAAVTADVPVTVVFGDHDRILTSAYQSRELVPAHTRWVRQPGCGHAVMWDTPVEVAALVEQTIAGASQPTEPGPI